MNLKRVGLSVRQKIILLTCGMALLACILIGSLAFHRISKTTIDTAIDGLAGETRLTALKFMESYNQMANDAFIVKQTPPIDGIIRSRTTLLDPADGSSYASWRSRLETIFLSIMESRPHYTQMRYIGLEDNGRELVRVNRTKSGFKKVPPQSLQQKGNEPYFESGLTLKDGEVFFSEVTYNREHGAADSTLTPTIRAVAPVYYKDKLFGMIVINADYSLLLKRALEDIQPSKDTLITNYAGDYFEYHADTKQGFFEFHDNYTKPAPEFIKTIKDLPQDEKAFFDGNEVAYFVRLTINQGALRSFLGIALRTPKKILLKDAYNTQNETLMLTIAIALFSLLVAGLVSQKLTSPLQRMTHSIVSARHKNMYNFDLPVDMKDEIGDLARAFQDLTQSLQKSEAKTRDVLEATARDVLENIVDGIITIDTHGNIESFNPACETIFGYSTGEVIGRNINMLMPEPYHSEHDRYLRNYKSTGTKKIIGIGREVVGKRKDGSTFPMDLSVSETRTSDTRLFTGIIRDITERKQMDIMKDEFISTVNHELRTPLTSIQGSLGLLKARAFDKLDKKGRRLLELSYDNCTQLAHLVNDILDIEKIAAGKMEYHMKEAEVTQLVEEIVERHQSYAEKYKVTFDLNIEVEDIFCKLDNYRFNQALANLLSNAAKFSPEKDTVTVTVKKEDRKHIRISVSDNGPGIQKDFYDKIFTKFAQVDSSSTRAKSGTGLGLNIAKTIIEAFGGSVTFDSEEGKGTTFHFVLPICDPQPSQETDE